jgi:hypothetical protein
MASSSKQHEDKIVKTTTVLLAAASIMAAPVYALDFPDVAVWVLLQTVDSETGRSASFHVATFDARALGSGESDPTSDANLEMCVEVRNFMEQKFPARRYTCQRDYSMKARTWRPEARE